MDEEIAFPTKNPDLRAPAEVEERYSNSPISEHNFFENVISFAKGKNHNRFAKLAKSSKDREWDRNVETVDVRIQLLTRFNVPGHRIKLILSYRLTLALPVIR